MRHRAPRVLLAAAIGVALALAGVAALRAWDRTPDGAVATIAFTRTVGRTDVDSLATAYAKALVLALDALDRSGEGRVQRLYEVGVLDVRSLASPQMSSTGLQPLQRQRVEHIVDELDPLARGRLLRDELQLYKLELVDSQAEDFDMVAYDVDHRTIGHAELRKATREVIVPVTRGRPTELGVTGVFDGGGGITLSVRTQEGETMMGVISVMERVTLQIVSQRATAAA